MPPDLPMAPGLEPHAADQAEVVVEAQPVDHEAQPVDHRAAPSLTMTYAPRWRVDLRQLLGPLQHGRQDPVTRVGGADAWRVSLTPAGPGTLHLRPRGGGVDGTAWGPGSAWLLDSVPGLLGARDNPEEFDDRGHPLLVVANTLGLRLGRTGLVFDALVPAVLEQKVTGVEATRSWRALVRRFGGPAPGPAPVGMRVPPSPAQWRTVASWDWHQAGVDAARSRAIVGAARVAGRVEETAGWTEFDRVDRRLQALPGVGIWTSAEVRQRSHGDPDAISVGDFHLAAEVGRILLGRRIDDAEMVDLLEPYRPHRHRVTRLLALIGGRSPRRAPRAPIRDHRGY